jgi:hypothetical protein
MLIQQRYTPLVRKDSKFRLYEEPKDEWPEWAPAIQLGDKAPTK